MTKRILLGAPIRQKPEILKIFLAHISRLDSGENEISYFFFDDNTDVKSSELLFDFCQKNPCVYERIISRDEYVTSETTHIWKDGLVWKVANLKDKIIEHALNEKFDYLFFVDSDLVLDSRLLLHLIAQNKDIVSEVFWTSWEPNHMQLPQVWLTGQYEFLKLGREERLADTEIQARAISFVREFYKPSLIEVGGLGACTLISRNALLRGVSFAEIDNLTYWGEDRHFCIRAKCLGLDLWADSCYPPLHLYRESDLKKVPSYLNFIKEDRWTNPQLTIAMTVDDDRLVLLNGVIEAMNGLIASLIVIDSTTIGIQNALSAMGHEEVAKVTKVAHIGKLLNQSERDQYWERIQQIAPDWMLCIGDEQNIQSVWREIYRQFSLSKEYRYIKINQQTPKLGSLPGNSFPSNQETFLFRYTPFFNYQWDPNGNALYPENLAFFPLLTVNLN